MFNFFFKKEKSEPKIRYESIAEYLIDLTKKAIDDLDIQKPIKNITTIEVLEEPSFGIELALKVQATPKPIGVKIFYSNFWIEYQDDATLYEKVKEQTEIACINIVEFLHESPDYKLRFDNSSPNSPQTIDRIPNQLCSVQYRRK